MSVDRHYQNSQTNNARKDERTQSVSLNVIPNGIQKERTSLVDIGMENE